MSEHFTMEETLRKVGRWTDQTIARGSEKAREVTQRPMVQKVERLASQTCANTAQRITQVTQVARRLIYTTKAVLKATVLVPVGMAGLFQGLVAPDLDITLMGIGYHRYFLFHSAIGLAVLKRLHSIWCEKRHGRLVSSAMQKVCGAALCGCAVGVGIHLLSDAIHPKSVVFPFFGSLINGTIVDDSLWLFGNALWAFKIAVDCFVLVVADDETSAREWFREHNPFCKAT